MEHDSAVSPGPTVEYFEHRLGVSKPNEKLWATGRTQLAFGSALTIVEWDKSRGMWEAWM